MYCLTIYVLYLRAICVVCVAPLLLYMTCTRITMYISLNSSSTYFQAKAAIYYSMCDLFLIHKTNSQVGVVLGCSKAAGCACIRICFSGSTK